jgi:glycosyltransferase involved in cell wall biosynthesis
MVFLAAGNFYNNASVQINKAGMRLKIGILGTRGVPNHYGGFEYFAAHLSQGLVNKGHEVTVYNSSKHPYKAAAWQGVSIVRRFDPESMIGVPGQFIYDLNCLLHAQKKCYDILLVLGYTSSSVWKFLYPRNTVIITNMDGLEWKRAKYSKPVRKFLKYAEKLAVASSRYHIADSPVIKSYLDNTYHINSKYIAYGACLHPDTDEALLAAHGIKKNNYFLLIARMEPENNVEMILDGYCMSNLEKPFVVVGNITGKFGKYLAEKFKHNKNILFTGAIFDEQAVDSLRAFCSLYFHGHSVGGTNPSLLGAMACRAPIAAHENPFNRAVLNNNALHFSSAADVASIINAGEYSRSVQIEENYASIASDYSWDTIISQYETYFLECHRAATAYQPVKTGKKIMYKEEFSK